jgi:hypothetical protein
VARTTIGWTRSATPSSSYGGEQRGAVKPEQKWFCRPLHPKKIFCFSFQQHYFLTFTTNTSNGIVQMGKAKRNRVKNRADPKAKPVKPPSDPELAAIREQRILPVVQDLQSADLKKRSAAAKAIAHIIEDTKCRKLLLREQIVRILFEQTLTDSNLETRSAGWGILRNLALEEESDFCVHLYRQDILTAIEAVVRDVSWPKLPIHCDCHSRNHR